MTEPTYQQKALDRALRQTERTVWNARPELKRIAEFAHARMCSMWAVLGVVLARIACSVPPNVVLPAIVGGYASLNQYLAIVGKSGSGKNAALSAGEEAVILSGLSFPILPLGSGEGISRMYASRKPKDTELTWYERSVLFIATEIDALAAQVGRAGATLGPQIREGFNGGALGFAYADPAKRVILPPHTYRLGLVVGIQPGRAGVLLDDEEGGTPQRFLFLPGTDSLVPLDPGVEPPPWKIDPPLIWPKPPLIATGQGKGLAKREILHVDPIAIKDIRKAAHGRTTGADDPLDGHALLVRLKVAAGLAFLAGIKKSGPRIGKWPGK